MLTPAITASSVSPPLLTISMALAQQFTPPLLRFALEITTLLGLACALTTLIIGSAAAPSRAARLLNVLSFMCVLLPHGRLGGRPWICHRTRARIRGRS